MKFSQVLFKPRWQNKDASVRRQAIADGNEPEMLAALPELACTDADAGVRLAALRRVDDIDLWCARSEADGDVQVRKSARAAYLAALCARPDRPPALPRRVADLARLSDAEIEYLAGHAESVEVRAAAMQRVTRASVLVERAIGDPDAQLRLAALARIDDAAALKRIAERTRKTDKAVSQMARERLQRTLISAGDSAAIATRAQELCERMHQLIRMPDAASDGAVDEIDAQWRALPAGAPETLRARYDGSLRLLRSLREAVRNPSAKAAVVEMPDAPAQGQQSPPAPTPSSDVIPVESDSFRKTVAAPSYREERSTIKRLLEMLEHALDSGAVLDAHRAQSELQGLLTATPADVLTPQLRLRLEPLAVRYIEMKRWQQWSNRQRRSDLCADIQTLAGSGAHPDALATRVREAREEWQRLDAAEGLAVDAAAETAMARRFHALCHRVLRPTRAYFAARKQLRHAHTEQTERVLAQIQAVPDDSLDWPALSALRGQARDALHGLDDVEPGARTALAQRLKQGIERLGTLCATIEESVAQARRKLVEQARIVAERGPTSAAAREVRQLQQQWQSLGKGKPRSDQALWREFRAACDAVFRQLDADRREQRERQAAARAEVEAVLGRFEALADEEPSGTDTMRSRLRDLDAQWRSLGVDDRELLKRQRQARERIDAALAREAQLRRQSRFIDALDKYALLRLAETGASHDEPTWRDPGENKFDDVLRGRWASRADATLAPDGKDSRELAVQLEFLAGIESPIEDRQLRMNHQVQRLSSRLRDGGTSSPPELELEALMLAWFGQAPASAELESRFAKAAQAVIRLL